MPGRAQIEHFLTARNHIESMLFREENPDPHRALENCQWTSSARVSFVRRHAYRFEYGAYIQGYLAAQRD
jgi:hypothetical protein